jgi:hypothetical protein
VPACGNGLATSLDRATSFVDRRRAALATAAPAARPYGYSTVCRARDGAGVLRRGRRSRTIGRHEARPRGARLRAVKGAEMIYEIRTYQLAPGSVAEVEKRFGEAYQYRKKYSELTGFFHT